MNLATEKGFRQALDWTRAHLDMVADGGVWAIPRSGCIIRIVSHSKLEAEVVGIDREPDVIGFMRVMGWQCKPVKVFQ